MPSRAVADSPEPPPQVPLASGPRPSQTASVPLQCPSQAHPPPPLQHNTVSSMKWCAPTPPPVLFRGPFTTQHTDIRRIADIRSRCPPPCPTTHVTRPGPSAHPRGPWDPLGPPAAHRAQVVHLFGGPAPGPRLHTPPQTTGPRPAPSTRTPAHTHTHEQRMYLLKCWTRTRHADRAASDRGRRTHTRR